MRGHKCYDNVYNTLLEPQQTECLLFRVWASSASPQAPLLPIILTSFAGNGSKWCVSILKPINNYIIAINMLMQASLLLTMSKMQTRGSDNSCVISLWRTWLFLYVVWIIKMKGVFFFVLYWKIQSMAFSVKYFAG